MSQHVSAGFDRQRVDVSSTILSAVSGAVFASTLALLWSPAAHAASLSVQVTDGAGMPLEDAVVYAEPEAGELKLKAPAHIVEIAQRKRQFIPLVTVVQAGTEISFPNYDTVKHHVYSFSPAKHFDLPLYSGKAAEPQLFDKAGTVVLGCNIHDKMIAYVQVVSTPFFAKTDATGKVNLDGLPAGKFHLRAWHYNLPPLNQVVTQDITLNDGENAAGFKLAVIKKTPAMSTSNSDY